MMVTLKIRSRLPKLINPLLCHNDRTVMLVSLLGADLMASYSAQGGCKPNFKMQADILSMLISSTLQVVLQGMPKQRQNCKGYGSNVTTMPLQ